MVSKILYFHPYLGKISNLTIIFFRMGWFNHQLECFLFWTCQCILWGIFPRKCNGKLLQLMSFSSKRLPPSPFFEPDFSLLSKLLVKSQCTIYFQIGQFYKYITGQQALKMIICLFLSSLFLRKKSKFLPPTGFCKTWCFIFSTFIFLSKW